MLDKSINFKYHTGMVTGDYSFSANNNTITLSGYVEKLENARIREAMQFEAIVARRLYVDEVNKLRASGRLANTFHIKREATIKAKEQAKVNYADVWNEVENIYKNPPLTSVTKPTGNTENNIINLFHVKDTEILVAVAGSDSVISNLKQLTETIEAHNADLVTNQCTINEVIDLLGRFTKIYALSQHNNGRTLIKFIEVIRP